MDKLLSPFTGGTHLCSMGSREEQPYFHEPFRNLSVGWNGRVFQEQAALTDKCYLSILWGFLSFQMSCVDHLWWWGAGMQ